jgi:hypothetical protein
VSMQDVRTHNALVKELDPGLVAVFSMKSFLSQYLTEYLPVYNVKIRVFLAIDAMGLFL